MIRDGQGMDKYIQLFVHPNILQIQLRTFVACMFAKLEKIEFLISFPEIFYILFSKAKGPK